MFRIKQESKGFSTLFIPHKPLIITPIKNIFKIFIFFLRVIFFFVLLQSQNTAVSSSSLVRTSGFHPGNRGSNPLETTKVHHYFKKWHLMGGLFV